MDTGETARIFGERYVLGHRITAGETREVWQAHDDIVSRAVALKIFFGPGAATPEWQRSFRLHTDRLVALSHPGIAKVYDHGESAAETWLAMAFVPGTPLSDQIAAGPALGAAEALNLIGQTALALAAAHDVGVVHGSLSPESVLVRDDGSVALIGFAVEGTPTRDNDVLALGKLATGLLVPAGESAADDHGPLTAFLTSLTMLRVGRPGSDLNDLGRTALALSASLGGTARSVTARPPARPAPEPMTDADSEAEAERKMVRNRLIVLGTIVVVGGAALLRFVGEGAGDVTVPLVTNLNINQADLKLTTGGLRPNEQCILGQSSGGVVVRQSPTAGHRVKAGSVVTLTYNKDTCP